jgi:outer membrane scaffolding protein for murein synthesis (MipA/OmpV family)
MVIVQAFKVVLVMMGSLLPAVAMAQPAPGIPQSAQALPRPRQPNWVLGVGVAPLYTPVWQGSRDMGLSIFPDLRLNYRDDVFLSVPDGLGWNMVNRDGWKLGPVVKLRFRRQERNGGSPFLLSGGSDALLGMGDVGAAGEAGGFAQKSLAGGKVRLRAEVRQGFGGHDGLLADTTLGWSDGIGGPQSGWRYGLGVRAAFGGRDFTNTYFGVNAVQAAATGLAETTTGGGLVSAGVNGSLTKLIGPMGRYGAITLFASHDQLGDVVARSSLIRERGQRGQTAIGLSYGARFSWD